MAIWLCIPAGATFTLAIIPSLPLSLNFPTKSSNTLACALISSDMAALSSAVALFCWITCATWSMPSLICDMATDCSSEDLAMFATIWLFSVMLILSFNREGLQTMASEIDVLATKEGLTAHRESVRVRIS